VFGRKLAAYEHYLDSSKVLEHADTYAPATASASRARKAYRGDGRGGRTVVNVNPFPLFPFQ